MTALSIERVGHVNNIVGQVRDLQDPYVDIFGADVFAEWKTPAAGSANSLLLIGDTCIEIFGIEDPDSILGRYLHKHGPGWHSFEWTVTSQPEAEELAASKGIRITDRADSAYAWFHPKDCHGILVEISEHHFDGDKRDVEGWAPTYWAAEHPLGITGLGAIQVTSRDPGASGEWLADLTGSDVAYEDALPAVGGRAVGVVLPGHTIEFIGPAGTGSQGGPLESARPGIHAVAFEVADVESARAYLADKGVAVAPGTAEGRYYIDRAATAGSLIELRAGR